MNRQIPVLLALALVASTARAEIVIPHVGRLVKSESGGDVPVTGTQRLRFGLYKFNVDPSGQNSLVWEDTYEQVDVSDGLYEVDLGDQTPITRDDLAEQPTLWLQVSIFEGSTRIDLSPRMRFEASALAHYARDSASLGGLPAADYLQKSVFDEFKSDLTGGSSGGISVPWSKITDRPARLQALLDGGLTAVTASGALAGQGTGESPLTLGLDSIDTGYLRDGAVTKEKLAADAVTSDLFPAGSIPHAKLSNCPEGGILKFQSGRWQCGDDIGGGSTLPFDVLAPLEQITGSGAAKLSVRDGGIGAVKLANDAVTGAKLASDATGLAKVTGGAAVMNAENVGIGIASPAFRFDVAAKTAVNGTGFLSVPANSLNATISGGVANTQVAVGDIVAFGNVGSRMVTAVNASRITYAPPFLSTTTNNDNLSFKITKPTARVGSLHVAADGHVGIGTQAPLADLHVMGDLKVSSSRIVRRVSVQTNTANHSTTTAWKLGPTFDNITGFKAGSLVRLTYHVPMRNDHAGWGGGYIEPQISFNNSTWQSLGSSGYDGGVMNSGAAIGSYSNTILVDPGQTADFSVRVRFYFKAYEGTVMINQNHDINAVSGTATIMGGVNGTQHYAKIIVEELY